MAVEGLSSLLVNKLTAVGLLVVGFLILASGYRYGSLWTMLGGCLLLAIGIVLLVLKIARRNQPRHFG
jgi:hypothetical protein